MQNNTVIDGKESSLSPFAFFLGQVSGFIANSASLLSNHGKGKNKTPNGCRPTLI